MPELNAPDPPASQNLVWGPVDIASVLPMDVARLYAGNVILHQLGSDNRFCISWSQQYDETAAYQAFISLLEVTPTGFRVVSTLDLNAELGSSDVYVSYASEYTPNIRPTSDNSFLLQLVIAGYPYLNPAVVRVVGDNISVDVFPYFPPGAPIQYYPVYLSHDGAAVAYFAIEGSSNDSPRTVTVWALSTADQSLLWSNSTTIPSYNSFSNFIGGIAFPNSNSFINGGVDRTLPLPNYFTLTQISPSSVTTLVDTELDNNDPRWSGAGNRPWNYSYRWLTFGSSATATYFGFPMLNYDGNGLIEVHEYSVDNLNQMSKVRYLVEPYDTSKVDVFPDDVLSVHSGQLRVGSGLFMLLNVETGSIAYSTPPVPAAQMFKSASLAYSGSLSLSYSIPFNLYYWGIGGVSYPLRFSQRNDDLGTFQRHSRISSSGVNRDSSPTSNRIWRGGTGSYQ